VKDSAMRPNASPVAKDNGALLAALKAAISPLPAPYPRYVLFVAASTGEARARVITLTADCLDALENQLAQDRLRPYLNARYLRLDWVTSVRPMPFRMYRTALRDVKRNYSRKGLSFDPAFTHAMTEAEINAHAVLYKGPTVPHCELNPANLDLYWRRRFGKPAKVPDPSDTVYLFSSAGVFRQAGEGAVHHLLPTSPDTGRRAHDMNAPDQIDALIRNGAAYLAGQVDAEGRFAYGWFPCFDRPINHYNTLRHASSTYALSEAFGHTPTDAWRAAIKRSLGYLAANWIISPLGPDKPAFLVDLGNEIKLGGNAVTILAICKYAETTGDRRYMPLALRLGEGILAMKREDGSFTHVLHAGSLQVKDIKRTVYYDGEAAFALMRLYAATGQSRWRDAVRAALRRYIAQDYWQYNDHWLAYCTTELALHDPEPAFVRFGILNVKDYLPFISERITTFPTLLELCCATRRLIQQALADPRLHPALDGLDLPGFVRAMESRAQYLANGVFFPEVAMHFRNPARITGSFFIRHHGFRVRIDDVEHYLSGLIAYRRYLDERRTFLNMIQQFSGSLICQIGEAPHPDK